MIISIYLLSLILFIAGIIYYSKPKTIRAVNTFFRDKIFNERYILIKRKKIAVIFFIFAFLLCSLAFMIAKERSLKSSVNLNGVKSDMAIDMVAFYQKELKNDGNNVQALAKLAYSYELLGEKNKAQSVWKNIAEIDESHELAAKKLHYYDKR